MHTSPHSSATRSVASRRFSHSQHSHGTGYSRNSMQAASSGATSPSYPQESLQRPSAAQHTPPRIVLTSQLFRACLESVACSDSVPALQKNHWSSKPIIFVTGVLEPANSIPTAGTVSRFGWVNFPIWKDLRKLAHLLIFGSPIKFI